MADPLSLPTPEPLADPVFSWGILNANSFVDGITSAYAETIHWRRNTFPVPCGSSGKSFVRELASLFRDYAEGSAQESIALKAISVSCILLLQRPHLKSKPREHSSCLERRLELWKKGHIDKLLFEGRCIQQRLPRWKKSPHSDENRTRIFANLVFQGRIKAALRVLAEHDGGKVLHANEISPTSNSQSVLDILRTKHPKGQPPSPEAVIRKNEPRPTVHPIIFDRIDGNSIRAAALSTFGAGGPSKTDAHCWRRLCSSFKGASNDLCHSLALVARRLCTVHVNPEGLAAFTACRLIALDKNPGVRPIGICEVPRRIIAKAVLSLTRPDVLDAAGSLQLCAGQISGVEAAIHAVRSSFQQEQTEAVLLIDASNAFNSLNRQVALLNIQHLCPALSTILTNCYRRSAELFMDGSILYSEEGTTQGDPLAMPMYALATVPLIGRLRDKVSVSQVWYADDASATGDLRNLRSWWDQLQAIGPEYGFHANGKKTWLVAKPGRLADARDLFGDTAVNITSEGRPYLGAPLGTDDYVKNFVCSKVNEWSGLLSSLSEIATCQPHAAYAALTHGLASKWLFLCRTTPNIHHLLDPLETIIRTKLLPSFTDRAPPNECLRSLFALPVRLGGLGVSLPTNLSSEFEYSLKICTPLIKQIMEQNNSYSYEVLTDQMSARSTTHRDRRAKAIEHAATVRDQLPTNMQYAMDLAQEKGASSWLTALPIEEHKFTLHKGAFRDALALRYGWQPTRLPTDCACGTSFTVDHALSCPKGGFPMIRHNEIRDFTACLMSEVCHDVSVEPALQPLSGEILSGATANREDEARLDFSARGFWGSRNERAFFDVRIFNPYAPSNMKSSLSSTYKKHEGVKRRAYGQRIIDVERGTFTPLVLSLTGGLGREANQCYKRLASLLSTKWNQPYSVTMGWLRCCLSFSLLRSSIMSIRGTRSSGGFTPNYITPVMDLVRSESGHPRG